MRLHRVRSEAMLGGVCAGLGQYFNIDVTVVRLVFVLLAILPGFGVLLYFVLWFVLPTEEDVSSEMGFTGPEMSQRGRRFGRELSDVFVKRRENTIRLAGFGLILLGLIALMRIFIPGIFSWIDRLSGPAILILLGGALLYLALKGGKNG